MLENFTVTENSNNRQKFLPIDEEDEIIIGGTCTHVFLLPFLYSEYVLGSTVIYKQGLNVVIEIPSSRYEIEERQDHGCFQTAITVKLEPEETLLFDDTTLDTFVQMKIVNMDGQILYNKPNRIKVRRPLDVMDPDDALGIPQKETN